MRYEADLLAMLALHRQGVDGAPFQVVSGPLAGLPQDEVRAGREKGYRETLAVALNVIDFLCAHIARDRDWTRERAGEWLAMELAAADRPWLDLPDD